MGRNLRFAAIYVALVAMVLRAMLPAGFMPGVTADGSTIVVCTMDGLVQLQLDADGKPVKQSPLQDDARHQQLCPFAAVAQLAGPTSAPTLIPPSLVLTLTQQTLPPTRVATADWHRAQSPRAPPLA
ncbi:MAG TPA: DUF2946 family protein [Rhizomicrobium sp.]|nr:DUF2946 family protein [Rhizomicrobium sp.]